MPVFDSHTLLESLKKDVETLLDTLVTLRGDTTIDWNKQPLPGIWSPIQIIEHLNSYNRYYLPEIHKALVNGQSLAFRYNSKFKSGWFGNYFTNLMLPGKNGKIGNKMNAPKDHSPSADLDTEKVLNEFIAGETRLLDLIKEAGKSDIGKIKVPISISKFIKLKAGDTFRFLIAHQQRHFLQLKNTLNTEVK